MLVAVMWGWAKGEFASAEMSSHLPDDVTQWQANAITRVGDWKESDVFPAHFFYVVNSSKQYLSYPYIDGIICEVNTK